MSKVTKNVIRTELDIKAIKPPAKSFVPYRDAEVGGLGLRVSSLNKRSWFLSYRCNGAQHTTNLSEEWPALTVKQARAEATQIKLDAKKGIDRHAPPAPVRLSPTLANLWPIYRQELIDVVEIKATTLEDYDSMYRVWLEPKWGNTEVAAITFEDVHAFHREIGATLNKRKKGGKMKRRANAVLALLRPFMDWAILFKHCSGPNPCLGVRQFKNVKRDRALLPDEGKRLWAAFDVFEREQQINPNCIRALRALLLTGSRETEITELEWAWLDRSEITHGGLGIFVPDSKTGIITTPLTKAFRSVLGSIDRVDGNPYVFASARKATAQVDVNHDQWTTILAEAKIEDFRIHDLRHTFGTWAKSYAGLSKDEVGSLLNHAGCSVTDIYARTVLERRLALAEMASQCILDIVTRGNDAVASYVSVGVKLDIARERQAA